VWGGGPPRRGGGGWGAGGLPPGVCPGGRGGPRGRTNRQIAGDLVISAKTVGHHVEHIYTKAGVSTRAGATLFAMEQQLL